MSAGPSPGEHRFRLAFGLVGLAVLGWAVASRPAHDIAWIEVAALAGLFFGGTAFASARALARMRARRDEDRD